MDESLYDIFEDKTEFGNNNNYGADDELFAILESLEDFTDFPSINQSVIPKESDQETSSRLLSQKNSETELHKCNKRQKLTPTSPREERVSHITVERNRRKQMNEHLSVLRSLMPSFYVKRGDQASIIEGVVDYINELQQLLQALEAKKQRKVYNEVLSPRVVVSSSPRPYSPLSPRKLPLSPRLNIPISPKTPQPTSPYKPRLKQNYNSTLSTIPLEPSPTTTTTCSFASSVYDNINELVANSKSRVADVEVKFSGPHVLLKTVSQRIPGQALKIISTLEDLALEILHVNINSNFDDTMLNSFTIKIGVECQLSAEELAQQIQQTFF